MHLTPMGPFSRWLLCTSEVRKDILFFLYCPRVLRRETESCVLLCSCSPPLVTAWLVSIQTLAITSLLVRYGEQLYCI